MIIKSSGLRLNPSSSIYGYSNKVKEFRCLFSSFIASSINKCKNEGTYVMLLNKPKLDQFKKEIEEQKNQIVD